LGAGAVLRKLELRNRGDAWIPVRRASSLDNSLGRH
jgi:hypothetical protein